MYDERILGKFLSVDPLTKDYPWYTPYQFSGNKPIAFTDLDGLEEKQAVKSENHGWTTAISTTSSGQVAQRLENILTYHYSK